METAQTTLQAAAQTQLREKTQTALLRAMQQTALRAMQTALRAAEATRAGSMLRFHTLPCGAQAYCPWPVSIPSCWPARYSWWAPALSGLRCCGVARDKRTPNRRTRTGADYLEQSIERRTGTLLSIPLGCELEDRPKRPVWGTHRAQKASRQQLVVPSSLLIKSVRWMQEELEGERDEMLLRGSFGR